MSAVPGNPASISIVIPSYQRGRIALDTIDALLRLPVRALEILIVDQTREHPVGVRARLEELARQGLIRWIVLEQPSIPQAMNRGLLEARGQAVLFLDDDIIPGDALVSVHAAAQANPGLVAGQVLQPGETASPCVPGKRFRFNSTAPAQIDEFMGGNFSIDRTRALSLRGFDENFFGAAYRFEAEFSDRYVRHFGRIRFEPGASIAHLAIPSGGTRAHGHHLRTAQPNHAVGAYYFLIRARQPGWVGQLLLRPLRAIRTRHHLRRPWWIPATLLAEVRGLAWAIQLHRAGARLLPVAAPEAS